MTPRLLKGSYASYFFFPDEESTIISKSKHTIVYLAAELNTKEKVVCKKLLPELLNFSTARLKFNLEACISLRHTGIAKTLDMIVENAEVYIIQ